MINRVTENMKFNAMTYNLFTVQSQSADLMEKLSTEKNINRPSDDPVGAGKVLNYRSILSSVEQYQQNITAANNWLSLTNTNLSGIKDIIAKAINVATTESLAGGDSATSDTRDSSVAFLSSLIDQALSLLNTKCGDSYLFGGSKTAFAPFSTNPLGSIGAATAAPVNTFDGTVTSGGTYTGTVNKNYAVKIIDGGTALNLSDATYQISSDGGATWGATQIDLSAPIALGDGITMTFTPAAGAHTLAAGDKYSVNATAATIGAVTANPGNTFDGTVVSGGSYIGIVNKTYLIDITNADTVASGNIIYRYSTDGGGTWTVGNTVAADGTSTLADGINLTFTEGLTPIVAGDQFTVNAGAAITGTATAAPVNTFDGTVVSSGAYTGMVDKTYALKIIAGGSLADATYQISADGGMTWGSTKTGLSSQITLGDGIKMTFTAGTKNLAAGDKYTVNAIATGIGAASAATANAFNGTVVSGGTYTGAENKTYAVKIITGGTLAAATYKISADGGKTWGAEQTLPPREVKGSIANTAGGAPVTAATVWNTITGANVQNGTTVAITGLQRDGITTVGPATFTIANAATGTVQDLLTQIEATFGGTVTASIDTAGKITVTDNTTGESQMAMTLVTTNPAGGSLNFGAVAATTTKTITLGDGITTIFTPNTVNLAANDLFTVNAYPAGSYRGDGDNLTMQIGKNNNFVYNITGSSAFTATNGPVAGASLTTGTGTTLTEDDNIMLTRGGTAGSWSLTNHAEYPNMVIASVSETAVTIDVDGTGTDVITLSLSGEWSANNTASFSITGSKAGPPPTQPSLSSVTVRGPGTVDLLTTLTAIRTALEDNDGNAITARIAELQVAQTQVVTKLATVGTKINSLTLTKENHTVFNLQIKNLNSDIEKADLAKLIVAYQMKQTALQASYSMAAQIGKMTILSYL